MSERLTSSTESRVNFDRNSFIIELCTKEMYLAKAISELESLPEPIEDKEPLPDTSNAKDEFALAGMMLETLRKKNPPEKQRIEESREELEERIKKIQHLMLVHLAKGYQATNGEICEWPEFNPEFEEYEELFLKLSLPYKGNALWIEVSKLISETPAEVVEEDADEPSEDGEDEAAQVQAVVQRQETVQDKEIANIQKGPQAATKSLEDIK